jgi:hypothetical protein
MGAVSDLLATGIANQFPERFLPDTALGAGYAHGLVGLLVAAMVIGLLLAAREIARLRNRIRVGV